jgi:hypothetical protein
MPKNEDARDPDLWRLNAANLQVAQTMHRPLQPVHGGSRFPRLRASQACAGDGRFEFPRLSHPSALLSAKFQVAPHLRFQPRFPMSSPGCPDSLIFRLRRRLSCKFPRHSFPLALPSSKFQVSPALCLQPRLPMSLRVSPNPSSSGSSGDGDSSFLAPRILQRCWRSTSGLPRILLLQPRFPDESPGCPGSCIFRPCRR